MKRLSVAVAVLLGVSNAVSLRSQRFHNHLAQLKSMRQSEVAVCAEANGLSTSDIETLLTVSAENHFDDATIAEIIAVAQDAHTSIEDAVAEVTGTTVTEDLDDDEVDAITSIAGDADLS